MDISNKKIIGFDLDGTLTQHKTLLDENNRNLLTLLAQKYHLIMFGAGSCERIYKQMGNFPIEIIGQYGMQHSIIKDGKFKLIEDITVECDKEKVAHIIESLRQRFNLPCIYGESVEFHSSGAVTFPILGTTAPGDEKVAYDPDRKKRRAIYKEVCQAFEGYNVFIGGSSSFDITSGPYNKFHAIKRYCQEHNLTIDNVIYVGDDFGEGGNDSPVINGGVDCVEVTDYRKLNEFLAFLLK